MHNTQQETIQYIIIMVFSIYTRRASEYRFFFLNLVNKHTTLIIWWGKDYLLCTILEFVCTLYYFP